MNLIQIISKLNVIGLFSVISVGAAFFSFIFLALSYFGIIDKNSKITLLAIKIFSNQTGIPLDEIEEVEGIKK